MMVLTDRATVHVAAYCWFDRGHGDQTYSGLPQAHQALVQENRYCTQHEQQHLSAAIQNLMFPPAACAG